MEEERSCDEESVSRVGVRVVAMEPLEVMVDCDLAGGTWREGRKEREVLKSWNGVRDVRERESQGLDFGDLGLEHQTADWLEIQ